jgi:hypothetical protein
MPGSCIEKECRSCNITERNQLSLPRLKEEVVVCLCCENKTSVRNRGRSCSLSLETEIELKKRIPNSAAFLVQDVRRNDTRLWFVCLFVCFFFWPRRECIARNQIVVAF